MASASAARFRRFHIWLGWIVGIPILLWVGVRPGHGRRGRSRRCAAAICSPRPRPSATDAARSRRRWAACRSRLSTLKQRAAGPRWVVTLGRRRQRASPIPRPGALAAAVSAPPTRCARSPRATRGEAKVASVTPHRSRQAAARTAPRRSPAWQVRMDRRHAFLRRCRTGEIAATRTRFWRVYDWMWGLHIMDLKTREDTHNPLDHRLRDRVADHHDPGAGAAADDDQAAPQRAPAS